MCPCIGIRSFAASILAASFLAASILAASFTTAGLFMPPAFAQHPSDRTLGFNQATPLISDIVIRAPLPPNRFDLIATYRAIGGLKASLVGPGPTPGSERFYVAYMYFGNTFDILSIDPQTGDAEVFHNPVAGEYAAESLAVGPDGNVYMGTVPNAHFLKLDTRQRILVDLGRPSKTEQYIWDVAFGSDNRLYGVTYPHCKLVRYDPATGKLEDLGRMDPTQEYAHYIVGTSDGFLYAGIGPGSANIAAYEIRTGQHREILSANAQLVTFATVYRGTDGNAYGSVNAREFRLNQFTATELTAGHAVPAAPENFLLDGSTLSLSENLGALTLAVANPKTHTVVDREVAYEGENLALYRIGFGPDGALYASSVLPLDLVKVDLDRGALEELGNLGGGEIYSFLSHGRSLLIGAYSGLSDLMTYEPGIDFNPASKPANPSSPSFPGMNSSWRPMAMIDGPGESVFVGVMAGYGLLQAPLIEWNPENASFQTYDVVPDQSVVSLVRWHDFIVGGTWGIGGAGAVATPTDANLFMWNPYTRVAEVVIVPVPGATSITDLIAAPNGLVYGIACKTLFEFNPARAEVTRRLILPISFPIWNSVAVDSAGRIWGLAPEGIFMIDTKTLQAALIAPSPQPITGGFAMRDGKLYFTSQADLYSYTL